MAMMTVEQRRDLVEKIVPEMILVEAKKSEYFNNSYTPEEIECFNGDTFQEYADGKVENEDFILELQESHGGYEGAGEEMWLVYSLEMKSDNSVIHFRINGWYNSWDCSEWEGIDIVDPKEVQKIEWVKA
jgi:hypothetical protein